ncbi:MAG: hypothetical protein ABUK01_09935 [Leptospirales bacterium]
MRIKILRITILSTIAIFAFSCVSIVKPGVEKVKKVALVSFKSNKAMINRKDSTTITSLATLGEGQKKGGNPILAKLLNNTSSLFLKEFGRIEQFKIISGSSVTGSNAYKKMVAEMKTIWRSLDQGSKAFFNQPLSGYSVIPSGFEIGRNLSKKHKEGSKKILVELAKALKVDAVILVDLDLGYEPSVALGGTGAARASVYITVYMINKDGEEVIVVYPSNKYSSSGGTLGMIGGNVLFTKKTMPVFAKEAKIAIQKVIEDIKKGL